MTEIRLNEDGTHSEFQIGTTVKCSSLSGIACYIKRWDQKFEPFQSYIGEGNFDDEDADPNDFIDSGEGDWVEYPESDQVYVVMIGDDQEHLVDVDDLELIEEDGFCRGCGQIGCSHEG